MAKNIDLTKPLSAADRHWLEEHSDVASLRIADDLLAQQASEGEAAEETAAEESEQEESDDDTAGEEHEDYSGLNKSALKLMCYERSLSQSGTIADLVERLQEDDAAKAAEESEEDDEDDEDQ